MELFVRLFLAQFAPQDVLLAIAIPQINVDPV
jgi:hypothetical protein